MELNLNDDKLSVKRDVEPSFVEFLKDMLNQQQDELRKIEQMKIRASA